MNRTLGLGLGLGLLYCLTGCGQVPPPIQTTRTVDVAACAKGDVETQLVLVDQLAAEFREMPQCGVLANGFVVNLAAFFANIGLGREPNPTGITYQGSGFYGAGTVMGLQTRLARDTSFGKAGDDLPFDLFDTSQYFQSIEMKANVELGVSLDTSTGADTHAKGNITVSSVTNAGPALELFGIDPTKPGATYDLATLAEAVGNSVDFGLEIRQGKIVNGKGIVESLSVPPMSVFSFYDVGSMPYEVIEVHAEQPPQVANLVSWDITYQTGHGSGFLDGTIVMRVDGEFSYLAKYEYPKQLDANISVTCAPTP